MSDTFTLYVYQKCNKTRKRTQEVVLSNIFFTLLYASTSSTLHSSPSIENCERFSQLVSWYSCSWLDGLFSLQLTVVHAVLLTTFSFHKIHHQHENDTKEAIRLLQKSKVGSASFSLSDNLSFTLVHNIHSNTSILEILRRKNRRIIINPSTTSYYRDACNSYSCVFVWVSVCMLSCIPFSPFSVPLTLHFS